MARVALLLVALLILFASKSTPLQAAVAPHSPLGVYAKVNIEDAQKDVQNNGCSSRFGVPQCVHDLLVQLSQDPAVSGLTVAQHWDHIEMSKPTGSGGAFDWSYLDDAFAVAKAAKISVQLIITPGIDSPSWLLDPSSIQPCDGLFTGTAAAASLQDCGTVTFPTFPESQRADGHVIPLGWNKTYREAWKYFLERLNDRYGGRKEFQAVAIAGPIVASDEMILPTNENTTNAIETANGLKANAAWQALITNNFPPTKNATNASYQNSDQAFIDAWYHEIDTYEGIFTNVTLFLGPDGGADYPNYGPPTVHADNTVYNDTADCATNRSMSCEAKTEVLSYFLREAGLNGKATQVGGMRASTPELPGDIQVPGVKIMDSLTPPVGYSFDGGAEFDHPVHSDKQQMGCPTYVPGNSGTKCLHLTTVDALNKVLDVFFYGTGATHFASGPACGKAGEPACLTIGYLEVPYADILYALENPCPPHASTTLGKTSFQDLLNRAKVDLFAMAGQNLDLRNPTCRPAIGP